MTHVYEYIIYYLFMAHAYEPLISYLWKLYLIQGHKDFSLYFPPYILQFWVLYVDLWSILSSCLCMMEGIDPKFSFFTHGYSNVPVPFVNEKIILSPTKLPLYICQK